MKKIKFFIASMAVVVLTVYACTKENTSEINDAQEATIENVGSETAKGLQLGSHCDPSNERNPHDYAGKLHNELVMEYIAKYDSDNLLSVEEVSKITNGMLEENSTFKSLKGFNSQKSNPDVIYKGIEDFPNRFENVIDDLKVSETAKKELNSFMNFIFEQAYLAEEPSLEEITSYVLKFEDRVLLNKSMSSLDKEIILTGTSIARYSFCYWYHEYSSPNKKSAFKTSKRPWWNWVVIGIADVGGGFAGGLSTGISASNLANTLTKPSNK